MGKDLNNSLNFSKGDIQMTKSYIKAYSTLLIFRGIQSKQQWDITSHPSEWLSSNGLQIANVGEDMQKREPESIVGNDINWCRHYGIQYGGSSKVRNRTNVWSSNSNTVYIYKNKDTCTPVFIPALFR